jgi:hypothetical protein
VRIRRTSAALALCTAAFVFAAQLAETFHVEAEHVVCPEHGELIHGAIGGGPISATDAVASLEDHEDHEAHCAHVFAAQGINSVQSLAWMCEATYAGSTVARRAAHASIPLLQLAPKSSPPISA